MKKAVTYINLVIAFLISAAIIYFLPDDILVKYKADIIYKIKYNFDNTIVFHDDINNDGVLESVHFAFFSNAIGHILKINSANFKKNKFWLTLGNDIYFIEGHPHGLKYTNDYNNNGLKEIYYFTLKGDSAFLNILELDSTFNTINFTRRKYFAKVNYHNHKPDIWIIATNFEDINKDGYDEITFTSNAGYSIQPRAVFTYDIKNDILKRTPKTSIGYVQPKFIEDANIFLLTRTLTIGNTVSKSDLIKFKNAISKDSVEFYKKIKDSYIYEYGDFSAYTIVLDTNMNFLFRPIEYEGYNKQSHSIIIDNKIYTLVIRIDDQPFTPYINIIDLKGNILQKHILPELKYKQLYLFYTGKNIVIQNTTDDKLCIYDTTFHLIRELPIEIKHRLTEADINNDGTNEFFSVNNEHIIIYNNNFTIKTVIPVSYYGRPKLRYHKYVLNNDSFVDFLVGDTMFTVKYYQNNLYFYRYIFYLLIFALVYSVIYLIYYIQKKQIQKRYEKENELTKLQLITIKNQLNPHFIFNALNSISSVIFQEDKYVAYHFITKFSSLIRTTLVSSDKISRSLKEEISFVSNYLELEKFRFGNKFNYEINIDTEIDQEMEIPKMCIQSYVENAVKHGFMHKTTKGHLLINVSKVNNKTEIIIKDDGAGRDYTKKRPAYSTGKGFVIMKKTFELFTQLTKKKIEYSITDLYDDNHNAAGTLVKILIDI